MASIRFSNITKRWGSFVGVDNLSLDIADREFIVLLGPSGCGKTTSMRMVAGLDDPTLGDIFIGDRRVNDLEPKDRDIAMVFQSYGLYAHLSVYENIRFPLKVRGIPNAEHDAKVRAAAAMVELTEFLERKPKALSGGQRQRVALARAIVRQPNCFLMDEPLSNLDAKLRISMRAEIKHLHHRLNVTTIYVTHDQVEAMTLADRVAVMEKGRIRQLGTPTDIYNNPANLFVAGFIGSPPMNLIEGDIIDGQFRAEGVSVPLPFAGSRTDVVLGIRAEDLRLTDPMYGHFRQKVYSVELLGDATLVSQRIGARLITARADKGFRIEMGATSAFEAVPSAYYLFDRVSGDRIALPA
ncbi:ABC transporter ATP-binding protein [Elstera cyanobacteriorum]|uniref:ABC transporter ATP-binding protein n=2 Tax=Elstera cyanobacteriorum TaxID=2022747 RepID=A0A255XZV6_9PROT|nr:ABC transporter ATP-binding protein [Elstera cyanobacteriorum]GGA02623.1 ABC transporter ATP-binding protein [Elstera cyanobacteriorum]